MGELESSHAEESKVNPVIVILRIIVSIGVSALTVFLLYLEEIVSIGVFGIFPPLRPVAFIPPDSGLLAWIPALMVAWSARMRLALLFGGTGFVVVGLSILYLELTVGRPFGSDDLIRIITQAIGVAVFFLLSLIGLVCISGAIRARAIKKPMSADITKFSAPE